MDKRMLVTPCCMADMKKSGAFEYHKHSNPDVLSVRISNVINHSKTRLFHPVFESNFKTGRKMSGFRNGRRFEYRTRPILGSHCTNIFFFRVIRMKKAAGVSDIEEVVRRFETQEETAKHLQELQVGICHTLEMII